MPTIGIGAGPYCDGQVLLSTDLLGVYETQPPFVKRYANLNKSIHDALTAYIDDVKKGKYPSEEYMIHMDKEEIKKLEKK